MSKPPRKKTSERGYGTRHQELRRLVAKRVRAGTEACARCGLPIQPDEPFDLDHSDDRKTYLGPSHSRCNRAKKDPVPAMRPKRKPGELR